MILLFLNGQAMDRSLFYSNWCTNGGNWNSVTLHRFEAVMKTNETRSEVWENVLIGNSVTECNNGVAMSFYEILIARKNLIL